MRIVIAVIVALGLVGPAWAGPKGKGHGGSKHDKAAAGASDTGTTSRPPGLSRQDKMPHGLEKQGKTPAGWSKGKKRGWRDWFTRKKDKPSDAAE